MQTIFQSSVVVKLPKVLISSMFLLPCSQSLILIIPYFEETVSECSIHAGLFWKGVDWKGVKTMYSCNASNCRQGRQLRYSSINAGHTAICPVTDDSPAFSMTRSAHMASPWPLSPRNMKSYSGYSCTYSMKEWYLCIPTGAQACNMGCRKVSHGEEEEEAEAEAEEEE